MNAKPKWFRFSLRTLLILITVLCCYLGYESSVVRQRRAELKRLESTWTFEFTTVEEFARRYPGGAPPPYPPVVAPPRVSLVRRSLGDEAIQYIGYYGHIASAADRQRVARVFPEARLYEMHPPLEPCHPGCFPHGTLVETPAGARAIESIHVGDVLITFAPSGEGSTAAVQSVFVTTNRLWQIETEAGTLLTTEIQPLCLSTGQTIPAGRLQAGDSILHHQGGQLQPVQVRSVAPTSRIEPVINLVLGDSQNFIAGGYLARSKPPAPGGAEN